MMPERILADLRRAMPRDAILTSDVGWNKNGVAQQFDILTPGSILIPGGFATMGFGPSAAIGAKIAAPDRVVISLVGDGGFGQNLSLIHIKICIRDRGRWDGRHAARSPDRRRIPA